MTSSKTLSTLETALPYSGLKIEVVLRCCIPFLSMCNCSNQTLLIVRHYSKEDDNTLIMYDTKNTCQP